MVVPVASHLGEDPLKPPIDLTSGLKEIRYGVSLNLWDRYHSGL